jgi:carbon storage regulator CsrA
VDRAGASVRSAGRGYFEEIRSNISMLVLSRKVGQKIVLGDDVVLVINRIAGNRVSIGIQAPEHVRIVRGELDTAAEALNSPGHENHFRREDNMSPGSKAVAVGCD